jgi:hypothetical protein
MEIETPFRLVMLNLDIFKFIQSFIQGLKGRDMDSDHAIILKALNYIKMREKDHPLEFTPDSLPIVFSTHSTKVVDWFYRRRYNIFETAVSVNILNYNNI